MYNKQIKFIEVNNENIAIAEQLHISQEQAGMVETVEECFAEAKVFPVWRPSMIMVDNELIGFAMYGLCENEGDNDQVWLDRFFIDERYQGKGYSNMVLPVLLNHITNEYSCKRIYLSVYENNAIAIHLYEKFGFCRNGELDYNGEKVMVRTTLK